MVVKSSRHDPDARRSSVKLTQGSPHKSGSASVRRASPCKNEKRKSAGNCRRPDCPYTVLRATAIKSITAMDCPSRAAVSNTSGASRNRVKPTKRKFDVRPTTVCPPLQGHANRPAQAHELLKDVPFFWLRSMKLLLRSLSQERLRKKGR